MFPAEFSAIFAKMLATKQVIADSGIAGNADTGAAADVSMLALLHQSFLEPASGAEPASAGGKKIKGIHDKIDGITRALNQHALFDSRYQQLCDAVANAAPTKEKSKLQRAGSEVSRLFGKFKIGVKSAIEKAVSCSCLQRYAPVCTLRLAARMPHPRHATPCTQAMAMTRTHTHTHTPRTPHTRIHLATCRGDWYVGVGVHSKNICPRWQRRRLKKARTTATWCGTR